MRKLGLTLIALLVVTATTAQAAAVEKFSPAKRAITCRYESWSKDNGVTVNEAKMMIDCATDKWPVSGGDAKAFYIANRESGFQCHAANPTSTAGGVFQMVYGTWASWWRTHYTYFRNHDFNLRNNRYLCRANIMVAIRSAHMWGWGPWGG